MITSCIYKSKAIARTLLLALIFTTGAPLFAGEIEWRTDYMQARQEAAQKNLPILIDFYTDNCFWCKQMNQRTFRDPTLNQTMMENWIPLRINARKEPVLTDALKIRSFPTLVFAGPDGNILGFLEGFIEAPALVAQLEQHRGDSITPDWMNLDYKEATVAIASDDYPKAVSLLKKITEDGKQRPIQKMAIVLLQDFEKQATERIAKAKKNLEKGNTSESIQLFREVSRQFEGTNGAKESSQILASLANRQPNSEPFLVSNNLAKEVLSLIRQDCKSANYLSCLDRYDYMTATFAEAMETQEAGIIIAEIKSNPEWMKAACEQMGDKLANLYLSLADSWTKKGQPQQAIYYLEKTIQTFPGTKYAESAQVRMAQLLGPSIRAVELKNNK
jgi:thioredoxin-related protein